MKVAHKLLKFGRECFLMPILGALLFCISVIILTSMVVGPLSLYWGAVDGLWNFERSIFVAIGLPALTLAIFKFSKIKQSILIKVWNNYFSINVKPS